MARGPELRAQATIPGCKYGRGSTQSCRRAARVSLRVLQRLPPHDQSGSTGAFWDSSGVRTYPLAHLEKVVYDFFVSSLAQIGSTQRHRPMVGSALCMAASARSIRVRCSRKLTGYNQVVDGGAHNASGIRSTRIPVPTFIDAVGGPMNARTGKATFEQGTRPDQRSR